MKRFYSLLSFVLLSIAGVSSAFAQGYTQGDLIETLTDLTGQRFCLYSEGMHGTGFADGTGSFSSTLTNDGVFELEATGNTSYDGYPTYLLKQVSTGKYFADYEIPEGAEDSSDAPPAGSSDPTTLTAEASEALQLVVLPFQTTDASDTRCYATEGTSGQQTLTTAGFVFTRSALVKDAVQYLGHLGKPFHSPYLDTNVWHCYSVTAAEGVQKLTNYVSQYYTNPPSEVYTVGTAPGQYKKELVDAAQAVYEEAYQQLNNLTYTDEQIEDLCARIESTMTALAADDARYGFTTGYYIIKNLNGRYLYTKTVSGQEFIYSTGQTYEVTLPVTTTADIDKIWYLEVAEDGTYKLQAVATGNYVTGGFAKTSATDDGYAYSLGEAGQFEIIAVDGGFQFKTKTTSPGNGHQYFHGKYNDGPVMAWNSAPENNTFTFQAVEANNIDELVAKYKQEILNDNLQTAVDEADVLLAARVPYLEVSAYDNTLDVTNEDESFGDALEGALVSAGGSEDDSHWYSNAKSTAEGSYEGLVDNDFTSYFHSDWSAAFEPSVTKNHYLVATLDQPVSAPGVIVKMAKRATGNDYPITLAVYGSNDFDKANPDAATWTDLGRCEIAWNTVDGGLSKGVGTAAGYIAEGQSYKYIKLAAIGTEFNASNPMHNRGYFAISECNLWQASSVTADTHVAPEVAEVPAAIVATLESETAKSKTEIAAGAATQAQIDALKAAIEDYNNNLPDPTRVTTAYNNANTFLTNVKNQGLVSEEETLGQYPQTAADALTAALAPYAEFSDYTLAGINAAVEAINSALNTFKASLVIPTQGKFYYLRSASQKIAGNNDGGVGVIYNALIYPTSTSCASSDVNSQYRFIRLNGSADITSKDDADAFAQQLTELKDSVEATDDNRMFWYIEKAEAGKIVLRNVGTGLYFATGNGQVYQSVAPVEIGLEGAAAEVFHIAAGNNSSGKAQYVNTKLATSYLVTWQAEGETNSNDCFKFDPVRDEDVELATNTGVNIAEGETAIVVLPVAVGECNGGNACTIVGITEDKSELIVAYADEIPAGTPFILHAEGATHPYGNNSAVIFDASDAFGEIVDGVLPEYTYTVAENDLIGGTLIDNDTIVAGSQYLYFNNGNVAATSKTANTIIKAGKGYIKAENLPVATEEDGDVAIELGTVVIDGVNKVTVVALPSVVNVYTIDGVAVRHNVKSANAVKGLPAGLYIVGGKKVIVK